MWISQATPQSESFSKKRRVLLSITRRIVSYINNLHPQDHVGLYDVIEKIIGKVIPLWNATLTPLGNSDFPRRIKYENVDYGDLDDYTTKNGPKQLDGENKYTFLRRQDEWKSLRKQEFCVRPNPEPFIRPDTPVTEVEEEGASSKDDSENHKRGNIDLKADYGATGLQIIVKLANVHLTPEKPEYEGGTWHVEGQLVCVVIFLYVFELIHKFAE